MSFKLKKGYVLSVIVNEKKKKRIVAEVVNQGSKFVACGSRSRNPESAATNSNSRVVNSYLLL